MIDGINHEIYLRPLANVRKALGAFHMGEQVTHFASRLGDGWDYIEYPIDLLDREFPAGDVSQSDLADLIESVEALARTIRASDVPVDAQAVFLEHLERLRRALVEYEFRGLEHIAQMLDLNLGYALRTKATTKSEAVLALVSEVAVFLQQAYTTLKLAIGLKRLASGDADISEVLDLPLSGDE